MADLIEFRCPHCNQLYRLGAEQLARHGGRASTCRKCGQAFTFPVVERPQAAGDLAAQPPAVPPPVSPSLEMSAPAVEMSATTTEQPEVGAPPQESVAPQWSGPAAGRKRAPGLNLGAVLSFRSLLGVPLVRVVFWIGVGLCLIVGIDLIVLSFSGPPIREIRDFTIIEKPAFVPRLFWFGLGMALIGPIFMRLACELCVVLFRMNGSLAELRREMGERKAGP